MRPKIPLLMGIAPPVLLAGAALSFGADAIVRAAATLSPDVLFSVPVGERVVALTIDDGPSLATDSILRVLAEHDARATFFLIGDQVDRMRATAERVRAQGHELAHHMMADQPSIRLPAAKFEASFLRMDSLLSTLGGTRLFRPGSGWYDRAMVETVARHGYRLVLGSVYPFDAQIASAGLAAWYVLANVRPGSIIVLHDGDARGLRTAATLRRVLPELERRGFRTVTVTELLQRAGGAAAPPAGRSHGPSAG